jgi:hypothetical protein
MAAPYAAYGVLYFIFLFMDRLAAWTAGNHPLPVWFDVPYEVGLEWGFLSVVLGIALLEFTIQAFSSVIVEVQERIGAARIAEIPARLVGFYLRQLGVLLVLIVVGALVTDVLVLWLKDLDAFSDLRASLATHVTRSVHWWSVAGYGLLAWALLNVVFLFSLSQPRLVLGSLIPAIAVDATVAFTLSRSFGHLYSVAGLASGALVFALITTHFTIRALRAADHLYYAAY